MCALMWRILARFNARQIHIRARHIPGNLNVIADSLSRRDRSIQTEWSLHPHLPSLAQANGGSVCHQLECQTANLRISCPRRQGLADRYIEYLLGGSGHLCLLSSGHPSSVSSENDHLRLQVQGHCDSTRVAGDALVLGSSRVVNQDSTEASSMSQSPKATLKSQIPQESGVSESPCVVPGLLQEGQGFLLRWQIELRHLRESPQGECMIQGGPYFKSGLRRIRWTSPNLLSLR